MFLKEDRAPHVIVGLCKFRYMYERERYLYQNETFEEALEEEESILARHEEFHASRGLAVNRRLPYLYGIWKSAKRNLRWISGARKQRGEQIEGKPEASIAGVGKELVGLLTNVMHALKGKDGEGRRQGKPKTCWFVDSVEEVAQPLRFAAEEIAQYRQSATTVDFVSMYPSFDQTALKSRLQDAMDESWQWENDKKEEGELRLRRGSWVCLSKEEVSAPAIGNWDKGEVLDLLQFVVDNGYIKRGTKVLRQVKGFGMGLACAGQMANLALYPVERDFAKGKQPKEVEHNYRFIDDINTLTGCIPTEEQYGMQYKNTRQQEGSLVFLGMELEWRLTNDKVTFVTGMHFRDAMYPIKIRRYPANGSMVTDSQRIGVIMGQFIRAQRLCSTMAKFKTAVQNIVLAGMRRGYKRRELDRVWGKFLMQWWKAQEMRRGELRAWFRKMTQLVVKKVSKEFRGLEDGTDHYEEGKKDCKFGHRCWYQTLACPFKHPLPPKSLPNNTQNTPKPPWKEPTGEQIPRAQGRIWEAAPDGSCMFHCVAGSNDTAVSNNLRARVAQFVATNWDVMQSELGMTPGQLLSSLGWQKEEYLHSVAKSSHWGDDWELLFLSKIEGVRLRVFREEADMWVQIAEYGTWGTIIRMLFSPKKGIAQKPHYDVILLREAWIKERERVN